MWLIIRSGPEAGRRIHVDGDRFVIGRDLRCDLTLSDIKVSRNHAYIQVLAEGQAMLHDMGSTNGTFVNGRPLTGSVFLHGEEEIRVGDTLLSVHPDWQQPQQEPDTPVLARPPGPGPVTTERMAMRRTVRRATTVAIVSVAAAVVVVVTVVALFLTGVLPPNSAMTVPGVVEAVRPSTVVILANEGGQTAGSGSGWVLDAGQGLIVTNAHVVNAGTSFVVGVNGQRRDASVVAVAPCEDLAVLKVKDTAGLRTLPLGSQSDLKLGDTVVALGYPGNASLQDQLTTTTGVVSVVQEPFRLDAVDVPSYPNVIQTNAAINPGNSGGPLVDLHGHLVGVNSAGITLLGDRTIQGQGYAIGVDRVKEVAAALRLGRSTGWTGMGLDYPDSADGLLITHTVPGTPAARAGLGGQRALITQINGRSVQSTLQSYCSAVGGLRKGSTAVFTVLDSPVAFPRDVTVGFA